MGSPPRPREITYRVTGRDQGRRLDLFLKERIPRMSREGIKEAILTRVAIAGRRKARPSTPLRAGDEVIVTWPPEEDARAWEAAPSPSPGPVVIHEDLCLLVVDKPAGMLVHATSSSTRPSLLGVLRSQGHGELHLVHRLDRETSGVVVLARDAASARHLSGAFARGEVEKIYVAVVFGEVEESHGVIDLPLGGAAGSAIHIKQGVDEKAGRSSRTEFSVSERVPGFTVLELRPRTGRRHQLRVHSQAIGHPIVGDKLYAARESHHVRFIERGFDTRMREELLAERQLLHAARITLPHPSTGRRETFAAPLPADIEAFISSRRARRS